jgi:hypothetical protein
MKPLLIILFSLPVFCIAQKMPVELSFGAGYAFYPGPSDQVNVASTKGGNPLKSGLTAELTAGKAVGDILHLGVGAAFFSFNKLSNPYVPVFADIRVIGQGRYKLFSFLDPGYGIFSGHPQTPQGTTDQKGGFYIAYGFGVMHGIYYLQAKYNWLHFSQQDPAGTSSKSYGVAGISFGVHLP